MAKGRVIVDEARCKGCALCTGACPQEVLVIDAQTLNARGYHPAQLVDPEGKCTGCALCAVICPDVCLTVYRFKEIKGAQRTNGKKGVQSAPQVSLRSAASLS